MGINFTDSQLEALALLADGEEHTATETAKTMQVELSNFLTDIIKPLISKGVCFYGEPRRTQRRGRPLRSIYIKNNVYVEEDINSAIEKRCHRYQIEADKWLEKSKAYRVKYTNKDSYFVTIEQDTNFTRWDDCSDLMAKWSGIRTAFNVGLAASKGKPLVYHEESMMFNPPDIIEDKNYKEYMENAYPLK
jgi:hypothetical protein